MTKISNQYSLTNILTADLANSRLGINNVSPTVALDVTGAGKFSSTVLVNSTLSAYLGTISSGNTPATSGTTPVNAMLNLTNNRGIGMYFGGKYSGDYAQWIQVSDTGNLSVNYPLLLNPNGGNVGIGTSTPHDFSGYTTLTVNNNTNGGVINTQLNGVNGLRMVTSAGNSSIAEARNLPLVFEVNAAERMRILANGNVGIGTSSPTNLLQVNGTGYFNGSLGSGGTISGSTVSASGTTSGATLVANSAIHTYNVQQYYYGNTFTFTPPNALNSGSFNSEMRIYLVWVIGVNGYTEAGLRVWLIAMNGGGTAYNANELLGRDANGGTGLNIYRSSASQISINSNNNAFIKFVSIMQLNAF